LQKFLNFRRQAILFAIVITVGIALFVGTNPRAVVGIIVIGLALAWPLGSDNRLILISISIFGFVIALSPFFQSYLHHKSQVNSYIESTKIFERNLERLTWKYPVYTIIGDASKEKRIEHEEVEDVYQFSYALKRMGYNDSEVESAKADLLKKWDEFRMNRRFSIEFPVKIESAGNPSNISYALEHPVLDDFTDSKQLFFQGRPNWYARAVASGIDVKRLDSSERPDEEPAAFDAWRTLYTKPLLSGCGLALGIYGLLVLAVRVHSGVPPTGARAASGSPMGR
jgi:hypothetical protein